IPHRSAASVGQHQADAPDGHEAIVAVDTLEIRVEGQELHPRLERPAAERGGDELYLLGYDRAPREVAEGLVLPVHRVVVLHAEAEGQGQADVHGVRRTLEE